MVIPGQVKQQEELPEVIQVEEPQVVEGPLKYPYQREQVFPQTTLVFSSVGPKGATVQKSQNREGFQLGAGPVIEGSKKQPGTSSWKGKKKGLHITNQQLELQQALSNISEVTESSDMTDTITLSESIKVYYKRVLDKFDKDYSEILSFIKDRDL